jgi:hypothetical protein
MIRYFSCLLFLTIFACGNNHTPEISKPVRNEFVSNASELLNIESGKRKLIKEGRFEFETENLKITRKTVFEAVDKYKGYVSSDQEYKSPGRKSNTIVIRVSANRFDPFLVDATQGVKKFELKEIKVKDVTEEFIDIGSRLQTKKELENRYIELLKQAKTVSEILEIEKQIGLLRSEIESIEGRLKYLEDQVLLSTLTMTFYESIPNETDFGQKFKNGFRNGWENFIWFLVGLTNLWPFVFIGLGLIIGFIIFIRKTKKPIK